MPRIVTGGGPAIVAAPGAHHYRFVGIEIAPKDGVSVTNLVELSNRATSVEALPHHIAFERCYLHGDKGKGGRRGIALNARDVAIVDSGVAPVAGLNGFEVEPADFAAVANGEQTGEQLAFAATRTAAI